MTIEESVANEARNREIRRCDHQPYVVMFSGQVRCKRCKVAFTEVLEAVLPPTLPPTDDN